MAASLSRSFARPPRHVRIAPRLVQGAWHKAMAKGGSKRKAAMRQAARALTASRRAESRYVLDLVQTLGNVHRIVLEHVLEGARADGLREDVAASSLSGSFLQRLFAYVRPQAQRSFNFMAPVVERGTERAATLIGIPPSTVPGLEGAIAIARERNIQLIDKTVHRYFEQVREILEDPENVGLRVEDLADLIAERGDVSKSYAARIARDQTTKLNGALTEYRQRAAGITEFTWSTSNDERVRPSHRELDGLRFRWDDPPIVDDERATPGSPVNCRCVAIPYVPELEGEDGEAGPETADE